MGTEFNKQIVIRFNKEIIEEGKTEVFNDLTSEALINHTAAPGVPKGRDGVLKYILILRNAFPDLTVEILDQIAEGDKVVTRKVFYATHSGEFMGIPATGKKVEIKVMDIVRLHDGKYMEHWGMNNLGEVIQSLK